MLVCSLPKKSRKGLAHDSLYTSATPANLVHHVKCAKCQHSCLCFQNHQTSDFNKPDHKSDYEWGGGGGWGRQLPESTFLNSNPIDRVHMVPLCLGSPLTRCVGKI